MFLTAGLRGLQGWSSCRHSRGIKGTIRQVPHTLGPHIGWCLCHIMALFQRNGCTPQTAGYCTARLPRGSTPAAVSRPVGSSRRENKGLGGKPPLQRGGAWRRRHPRAGGGPSPLARVRPAPQPLQALPATLVGEETENDAASLSREDLDPEPISVTFRDVWDEAAIGISTGIQLVFLGTGAEPSPERAASCVVLRKSRSNWLFDAGEDAQRQIMLAPLVRTSKIDRIFLTSSAPFSCLGVPGDAVHDQPMRGS
eukprot:jgi/Botrbrau1/2807/Bobra.0125s0018.1